MIKEQSLKKIAEYLNDLRALRGAKDQLALYQQMRSRCMTSKKRTYDHPIKATEEIIENLQLAVNRDKRDLSRLVDSEDDQFYVFYLHYVKKRTLKETAEVTNYSKDGVVSILRRIKQKCTQMYAHK